MRGMAQGLRNSVPKEVAWRPGFLLDHEQPQRLMRAMGDSNYGRYLPSLLSPRETALTTITLRAIA